MSRNVKWYASDNPLTKFRVTKVVDDRFAEFEEDGQLIRRVFLGDPDRLFDSIEEAGIKSIQLAWDNITKAKELYNEVVIRETTNEPFNGVE